MNDLSEIFDKHKKSVVAFIDGVRTEAYKQGRKDALEDYRKWVKDSPECDDRPCDGMCIDCFIRMEKEKKNEQEHY